jgi:cardiolipin synthase
MKIFKKIFSKAALVFLAIVLQVLPIVFFLYYFADLWWQLQLAFQILAILLAIVIINKKENPEFKAPWLIIILLFPIFGVIVYLLFANHYTRPRDARLTRKVHKGIKEALGQQASNNQPMEDFLTIGNYIENLLPYRGTKNNNVIFFPDGQSFFDDLFVQLEKAEKFIFMEYFIIGKGVIWNRIHEILQQKVKQGVEVRLIYDDIGSTFNLRNGYYKTLRKEGIKCHKFNPFRPLVSGIYNNRDHRKICVIDHRYAYTGGINLADEYANINAPFGYWKDTGVRITGVAVKNFIAMFLSIYDIASKTITNYLPYLEGNYPDLSEDGFTLPFSDGPRPFYQENIAENVITSMINGAKKEIYISTPYLIPPYRLLESIRAAALKGLDVRIIVPSIPDKKIIYMMSKSNFETLIEAGAKIYYFKPGFNHAKCILIDDQLALVGTINLDFRSLVHHYEDGVLLYKTSCIKDISNDFLAMLNKSEIVTKSNFKFNVFLRLMSSILKLFSSLL